MLGSSWHKAENLGPLITPTVDSQEELVPNATARVDPAPIAWKTPGWLSNDHPQLLSAAEPLSIRHKSSNDSQRRYTRRGCERVAKAAVKYKPGFVLHVWRQVMQSGDRMPDFVNHLDQLSMLCCHNLHRIEDCLPSICPVHPSKLREADCSESSAR